MWVNTCQRLPRANPSHGRLVMTSYAIHWSRKDPVPCPCRSIGWLSLTSFLCQTLPPLKCSYHRWVASKDHCWSAYTLSLVNIIVMAQGRETRSASSAICKKLWLSWAGCEEAALTNGVKKPVEVVQMSYGQVFECLLLILGHCNPNA